MSRFITPLKVGAVVLLFAGAFGIGLTLIGGKGLGGGKTYNVSAVFDDASGLGVRTRVQIAGIVIGTVEAIELDENSHARVHLRLQRKFQLYKDASIYKRSDSILGARAKLGVTSLVISHDIGSAFHIADQIAMLHHGVIVAQGTPKELRSCQEPHTKEFLATWFGRN